MTWMSLQQVPVKINRTSHSLEKWSTTEQLATFSHSTQWKSYIQSPAPVSSNLIHSQFACWLWKSFQVCETLSISVMREYLCLFQKHDYMNHSGVMPCPSHTQKNNVPDKGQKLYLLSDKYILIFWWEWHFWIPIAYLNE